MITPPERLERAIESWLAARDRLTVCITALDRLLAAHPVLPGILMELQSLRSTMSQLAEELTVLAQALRS